MTSRDQIAPEFFVIVYLAVEHYSDRCIFVGKRLPAPREIYDRQSAHSDSDAPPDEVSGVIRAPVLDHFTHACNYRQQPTRYLVRVITKDSCYPAHLLSFAGCSAGRPPSRLIKPTEPILSSDRLQR